MASTINLAFNLETIQTQAQLSVRWAERSPSPTECRVIAKPRRGRPWSGTESQCHGRKKIHKQWFCVGKVSSKKITGRKLYLSEAHLGGTGGKLGN